MTHGGEMSSPAAPLRLRLGTRGSRLALIQSEMVAAMLRARGHQVELVRIATEGDLRPIDMTPGEGVFVAAIARALVAGEIDVAVHSAKDIPLEEEPELVIAAYPAREDPRDALVTAGGGAALAGLAAAAVVGTDSPRRAGFLRAVRADLHVVPLHGNVDTRLRRLDEGQVAAVVLAVAGILRLALGSRIDERLDPEQVTPAPAQGALAIQARRNETAILAALSELDQPDVRLAVEVERAVLTATGGTCRAPVGAVAQVSGGFVDLLVGGVNSDGSGRRVIRLRTPRGTAVAAAHEAGRELAAKVALR